MNMVSRFVHPSAMAEFLGFLTRFCAQDRAKAVRFEQAFDYAIDAITAMPEAWALVDDTYRFYRVKGFPHVVYYRVDGDLIIIAGVGHERQQPGFWRGR
jgi:plasmid stabilization system protein ParE